MNGRLHEACPSSKNRIFRHDPFAPGRFGGILVCVVNRPWGHSSVWLERYVRIVQVAGSSPADSTRRLSAPRSELNHCEALPFCSKHPQNKAFAALSLPVSPSLQRRFFRGRRRLRLSFPHRPVSICRGRTSTEKRELLTSIIGTVSRLQAALFAGGSICLPLTANFCALCQNFAVSGEMARQIALFRSNREEKLRIRCILVQTFGN